MKRKFAFLAIGLLCAMGAFAQDFPAYLKMKGTKITGCHQSALPANLVIPEGVTEIGNCAFYDCKSLASVSIPASVTEIGPEAFLGCESLKSVSIPRSVTKIGSFAFSGCDNLTVWYDGTERQWNMVGKFAYIGIPTVRCSDGEAVTFDPADAEGF